MPAMITSGKPSNILLVLLTLNTVVLLFHISLLLKIVPYDIAWGGRLKSDAEMYQMEAISIAVNLLFSAVLLIKGGWLPITVPVKVINILLWIFLALFLLNTIGNLFAATLFEKCFAVVTLIFSLLIGIVLLAKK